MGRKVWMIRIKIKSKKTIIIGSILLTLLTSVVVFVLLLITSSPNKEDIEREEQIVDSVDEEVVVEEIYNYELSDSASLYEKELFNDLELILSKEEVNDEEYAVGVAKVFVADLFTLSSKKGSSDVTSSQYVYNEYQDKYKSLVMDGLYSSIELNLDGKRSQKLPTVKLVELVSVGRESFSYKGNVIDSNAFKVRFNISYEVDMGYPVKYEVIIVKSGEVLEVVKSYKV